MSDSLLTIAFLSRGGNCAAQVRKTLSHIYPGFSVCEYSNEKDVPSDAAFIIIDAETVQTSELEGTVEKMSEASIIILVSDFSKVRLFSHMLSGRRGIVTYADLEGMGLIQCVHHLLERQKLHEQLKKASRHLKELSIHDDLTRLFNHKYMDEILSTEIKKANRYKRALGLVLVSIKNFSMINEQAGHHEGDRVLQKTADVIRSIIRSVDIPTRYGDNEFAILLPESDETATSAVAKRIQETLACVEVATKDGDFPVITNCGVATLALDVQTKEDLLRTATAALQEAKRSQNNSICTSSEITARHLEVRENRQLIEHLHERLLRLTSEVERNYFYSVMKIIGELPHVKRLLIPHSERVAFFAQRIAESLGLSEAEIRSIHRAGLLHDAGKLAIDSEILSKSEMLSKPENDLIRQHPVFAMQILGSTPFVSSELPAILHHHERMDGKGYPEGLLGESIPLHARIIAIAEAWDTMITPQPYRIEPLSLDRALLELKKSAGTQFDSELVDKFTGLISG